MPLGNTESKVEVARNPQFSKVGERELKENTRD